uniref:Uncharacterized protein n=1 Tax=Arundo donax TaxID=35708 RepID=A0A0A9BLC4_ARUDO
MASLSASRILRPLKWC